MAFPNTPVLDNFNRADAGPPPSASWASDIRAKGVDEAGMRVRGNELSPVPMTSPPKVASAWWNAPFSKDQEVYVTQGDGGAFSQFELWARMTNPGTAGVTGYLVYFGHTSCVIQKYGSSTYTDVGAPMDYPTGPGNTLDDGWSCGFGVSGNVLSVYLKSPGGSWTLLGQRADSTYTTGSYIGLLNFDSNLTYDDFGGGAAPSPPAFPTTPVLDQFTRANTGPPPSASWTNDMRGSAAPGLAVVSNAMKGLVAGPGSEQSSYWNTTFRNDCEAYFTCVTANPEFQLWCRGSGFSGALPQAYLIFYRPSASEIQIQKYGPGAAAWYTTLGPPITGVTLAAGDSVGITVIGSTISAWKKPSAGAWTLLGSRTDTSFPSGGQIGLMLYDNTAIVDSFGGGSTSVPIAPSGVVAPAGSLQRQWKRTLTGLITPHGTIATGRARTQQGTASPAGALATAKTLAPTVILPTTYRSGMDEMLYAALPWAEAQEQLSRPGVEGNSIGASCGWHGETFDVNRGSYAIVARDGPLAEMVGERLALTRRDTGTARTVFVYCLRDSDELTEDISVTRRAFMGLGDPSLDDVPVVVDTVGAS